MSRTKKERLEYCHDWMKRLDTIYKNLKDKRDTARKFRDADSDIVMVIEGRSKLTTTDMQDAIDMAKPDILETLAGTDEPLKLEPDAAKWVEPVKKLQVLGNIMIRRKNNWWRVVNDFLDDSMVLQFGCIKYRWIEEDKSIIKEYRGLTEMEKNAKLLTPGSAVIEPEKEKEQDESITKIKYDATDSYVRLDAVPSERIKFPLDTKTFDNAPFVVEEIRLYEHEFVKNYGQKAFDAVKKAKEEIENEKPDSEFLKRFKHVGGLDFIYSSSDDRWKAYECYFYENGTPWLLIFSADYVIEDVENKYGKPPYRGGSPFLMAHSLIGKGYLDYIKEIQMQRTYMKRSIYDVVSNNAFRRYFTNLEVSGMNTKDYENNSAMNALIRCTGDISERGIRPEDKPQLYPEMLQFWEMLNVEKDAHIPTPRAFGGLEGAKDEKTYRGKQLKVSQASRKLQKMLRDYMEDVFSPLFQDILDCIAKFMDKSTTVRYLNEDYDISPEDIVCKYALVVNVGLGTHDKNDTIVKLQQLIGLMLQIMQAAPGTVTSQNLYYVTQEIVKTMGFLNVTDFVTDPKLKEQLLGFVQMIMMLFQQLSQIPAVAQEIQMVGTHVMQSAQQLLMAMGVTEQDMAASGGLNMQGTQPGQKPAEIQSQPSQPAQTRMTPDGGGFFG